MGNDQKKQLQTQSSVYHPDIVVVSSAEKAHNSTGGDVDSENSDLNKLNYVPLFYPIIKSSIGIKEDQILFQLNPESMIKLSELLKNYLNSCASNISKDQEAINTEIKHVNFVIDILMQNFIEKQKKYAKYCDQFKTVQDISNNLKKIQRSMNEIIPMMDELNNFLPEADRLEEFTFK